MRCDDNFGLSVYSKLVWFTRGSKLDPTFLLQKMGRTSTVRLWVIFLKKRLFLRTHPRFRQQNSNLKKIEQIIRKLDLLREFEKKSNAGFEKFLITLRQRLPLTPTIFRSIKPTELIKLHPISPEGNSIYPGGAKKKKTLSRSIPDKSARPRFFRGGEESYPSSRFSFFSSIYSGIFGDD